MGGDRGVMEATFREVQACRKAGIMINTFMLASDYYLVEFVKQMTAMTNGRAYFANPSNLSQFVLIDFLRRRKSRVKYDPDSPIHAFRVPTSVGLFSQHQGPTEVDTLNTSQPKSAI